MDLALGVLEGVGVDQVGGQLGQGASTNRRRHMRGWGISEIGTAELHPLDPEHVDVERPGPSSPDGAPPVGRAFQAVAQAEQLPRAQVGGELDHQVEVGPLGRAAGAPVSYTSDTARTDEPSVATASRRKRA